MKLSEISVSLTLIVLSLLTVSCYKDAYKIDENFVGGWSSIDGYYGIEIMNAEVEGAYYTQSGENIVGRVKIKNNKLKIDNKVFAIDQFPSVDSSAINNQITYVYYSMILDDIKFIDVKESF